MTNTKRTILDATAAEKTAANNAYDTAAAAVWAEHLKNYRTQTVDNARQEAAAAGRAAYVKVYAGFGIILNTVN